MSVESYLDTKVINELEDSNQLYYDWSRPVAIALLAFIFLLFIVFLILRATKVSKKY